MSCGGSVLCGILMLRTWDEIPDAVGRRWGGMALPWDPILELGVLILDLGLWIGEWRRGRGGSLPPPRPQSHEPWHQGLWIRLAANPNRSARVAHLRSMSP